MDYYEFFKKANGFEPFPYQVRLAKGAFPSVLDVPTGAGKTNAVILAWLWKRRFAEANIQKNTPRRLVYCLPMRVLVEQTRDNAILWLHRSGLLGGKAELEGEAGNEKVKSYTPSWEDNEKIAVTVLMGGEDTDKWDYYPERDAIIIGTQDMLLSRALNRGYAMSRYRWPVHYALLNNDCLWVMDEVQLMGVGVETSAQMQAFRDKLGCNGNTKTLWMSATVDKGRLETVDHPVPEESDTHTLGDEDARRAELKKRLDAKKSLEKLDAIILDEDKYYANLAKALVSGHVKGTLSLAIINTVDRARKVYRKVEEEIKAAKKDIPHALIHSRFRSGDRKKNTDLLLDKEKDRIVVATQVIEAGVDVSATRLITEIAPWPSLVQRFGRCNRYGECDHAKITWVDAPPTKTGDEKKGKKNDCSAPYNPAEMESARKLLGKLNDAGIKSLKIASQDYRPSPTEHQVIRKCDVIGLFDTTPDLTGNDLDVSRYIRESDDTDVQVFWKKNVESQGFEYETPSREELCSIPIGDAKKLLGDKSETGAGTKLAKIWRWNPRDGVLELMRNTNDIVPGQILLLDCKTGGYDKERGWDVELVGSGEVEGLKGDAGNKDGEEDSDENDRLSYVGKDILLNDHTKDVEAEVWQLTAKLGLAQDLAVALKTAALWHDVGKSHEVFQKMLRDANPALDAKQLWAKSKQKGGRYERKHFRHELASALAWLQNGANGQANANLIAYVIAAHHGKVRLLIRSMPGEKKPEPPASPPYARGVWTGDGLPIVSPVLPSGAKLNLSPMELGEGSWLERTLGLRNDPGMGPFRLAYYEMLLRIADWRASQKEGKNGR